MDSDCGYDYREFLVRRARRFKSILPLDEAIDRIAGILESGAGPSESRMSHPDITAANLVREEGSGRMVSIDNELITQSPYYSIDLFNTARSFEGDERRGDLVRYLEAYAGQGGSLEPLAQHPEFFAALWCLRLIGTALQNGDLDGATRLAGDFVAGTSPTPPVVAVAREICGS